MIEKKDFINAVAFPLEKAGLVKKGLSWYLDSKETIIVVNLQKSNWSDLYYMNIGIWLKAFGEKSFPKFNHCHMYYRVEDFFPEKREMILLTCSLEDSNLVLLSELSEFIECELLPFLQECTGEGKLRDLMLKGILGRGFIKLEAKWYLAGE